MVIIEAILASLSLNELVDLSVISVSDWLVGQQIDDGIHTINRIYQGTSISTEYICQLSQVLGVSTDYLLLGKKDRMEEKTSREEIFQILGGLDDTKLIKLAGAAKILYDIA